MLSFPLQYTNCPKCVHTNESSRALTSIGSIFAYVYPSQTSSYRIYLCKAFWNTGSTGTDSRMVSRHIKYHRVYHPFLAEFDSETEIMFERVLSFTNWAISPIQPIQAITRMVRPCAVTWQNPALRKPSTMRTVTSTLPRILLCLHANPELSWRERRCEIYVTTGRN